MGRTLTKEKCEFTQMQKLISHLSEFDKYHLYSLYPLFCKIFTFFSTFISVPPTWKATPSDSEVINGDSVALNCQASGKPEPKVTWLKSSGRLFNVFNYYYYSLNSLYKKYKFNLIRCNQIIIY